MTRYEKGMYIANLRSSLVRASHGPYSNCESSLATRGAYCPPKPRPAAIVAPYVHHWPTRLVVTTCSLSHCSSRRRFPTAISDA